MAEQLTHAEKVKHALVERDLHSARAHHAQELEWPLALREDSRAEPEELNLNGGRDAFHVCHRQRVEWPVRAQEVDRVGRCSR